MLKQILRIFKYNRYNFLLLLFLMYCKKNFKTIIFLIVNSTNSGKAFIESEKDKAIGLIKKTVFKKKWKQNFKCLPNVGVNKEKIFKVVTNRYSKLNNKISGTVYNNKQLTSSISNYMYNLYQYSNPLHTDIFPELIKMESEIISMIGKLFELPDTGGGNLTTGGTESTILAIKAYKKYKQKNSYFNWGQLEVITTKAGHAAINKACELLDLKLVYVNLTKDYKMDCIDLKKKISLNTCVVIASYPCYAYGTLDPIQEISEICKNKKVPLHVDACLGGFITQFDNKIKISLLNDIDSISVDPHKFGYAPKGSSVLLWRENKMRHYQYFIVNDWTGGIYASSSLPGSRVGSQIATTWAVLLYNGKEYYNNIAKKIMDSTVYLKNEINKIDTFQVLGEPNVNVVAFNSTKYPLAQILDNLSQEGWNLNILQNPKALHICLTPYNMKNIENLILNLRLISLQPISNVKNNMLSIYGMATKIDNTEIINQVISGYLDLTTKN